MRPETPEGIAVFPVRTPTLPPATQTNTYLLEGDQAVLVDPGTPYESEQQRLIAAVDAYLGNAGGQLGSVFLTHQHPDHVGAAQIVADHYGVAICAHPFTLQVLGLAGNGAIALNEGAVVEPGPSSRFSVLHTPGHAAGHLCLFDLRRRYLIAGDMVPGIGTILIDPPEGDMSAYLDSLARLATLDPDWVLPAHGPSKRGRAVLEQLIAHRLMREEKVLRALDSGPASLGQIVPRAYDDTPKSAWPLATRSSLAHLEKLLCDGRVQRVGDEQWSIAGVQTGHRSTALTR
jgi:glyoxylase-like metal-dependent hydrolase (beta-lactamase superfamily II)